MSPISSILNHHVENTEFMIARLEPHIVEFYENKPEVDKLRHLQSMYGAILREIHRLLVAEAEDSPKDK